MTTHHFSYKELLMQGWEKTKQHFWFLFWLGVTYIVINAFVGYIPVVGNVVALITNIAALSIMLLIVAGHTPKMDDIFKPFKTYKITWHYFLATIVTLIAVGLGTLALIIPGIYIAVKLQFFPYLIIEDENLNPIDALKRSWKMTDGNFWRLLGWMITMVLVNFVGMLALGIGLIFTIPATWIAHAYLYKRLSGHHQHA